MLSGGLFAEKRLFCMSGWFLQKEEESWKEEKKKEPSKKETKANTAEERIIRICEKLPDDHFVIFSWLLFSKKKSKLISWLWENADIRSFDNPWNIDVWKTRFPTLEIHEITEVVQAYKIAESGRDEIRETVSENIANSLEKLELLHISRPLKKDDIQWSILTESSGKIFELSDMIFTGNREKTLSLLHTIMQDMNSHAFVPLLTWIIRSWVYVRRLKENGKNEKEIGSILSAHPYVIQKSYRSQVSYNSLVDFYKKILSIDNLYRSGKWLKDVELWRILSIELAIMGLKKQ